MTHLCALLALLLVLTTTACGTSAPSGLATPTSLFSNTSSPAASQSAALSPAPGTDPGAAPSSPAAPAAGPQFTVAVVVDTASKQVSREQAAAVVGQASKFLREFSPIGLLMVDFVQDGNGGDMNALTARYMNDHAASLPNGLVIFSTAGRSADATGSYGFTLEGPAGFRNAFVSPSGSSTLLYVAVVDYGYRYMACGYGGSDIVQGTSSLPGECRGQTGIACVSQNGYSMCSNGVGNLYGSSPTYAVSSLIVHSLLHNFAPNGDQDHYATPQCNARMGYPAAFFDLQESEYYNGLCPFVYEDFSKSYRP